MRNLIVVLCLLFFAGCGTSIDFSKLRVQRTRHFTVYSMLQVPDQDIQHYDSCYSNLRAFLRTIGVRQYRRTPIRVVFLTEKNPWISFKAKGTTAFCRYWEPTIYLLNFYNFDDSHIKVKKPLDIAYSAFIHELVHVLIEPQVKIQQRYQEVLPQFCSLLDFRNYPVRLNAAGKPTIEDECRRLTERKGFSRAGLVHLDRIADRKELTLQLLPVCLYLYQQERLDLLLAMLQAPSLQRFVQGSKWDAGLRRALQQWLEENR